ncbi:MAG TPA: AsmA-like C-terminal region-containing protein [Burkholderiales bacterium]|jgi:uncharacterized protein YhdP|nr:AsmA-like C-terminal region-containing protein [Burkholderiales bacterium]
MRRLPKALLRALEILAWASFFAFAAIFLSLRYWILPDIERYRGDIVAAISQAIGLQVEIGKLAGDWQGLHPRISIADVRVHDRDGREALVLPLVENVVSWHSLVVGGLRLRSFTIDGPKLTVRRDKDGKIFVAGIGVSGERGDGRLSDWILRQKEIVVRGAEVEWVDEKRGAPALELSALNFRLANDGNEHSAGLSARPPRELGPGLDVRAQLEGASVKQPDKWSGRVFAELGSTDLAGWRPWVDYPVDLRRGRGALRVWLTLGGGEITHATADVALSRAAARLASDLPLLEVTSVRGRLYGRRAGAGYEFGVRGLSLETPGTPPMNATSFRASWQPAAAGAPQRGMIDANLLELGPLAHLAEFLPFPDDLRKLLAELGPQGNLLDARFDWTGRLPDEAQFSARSRFTGLTLRAWRSIPGFANLSGSLEASEKKGTLKLASRKSRLDLPKVFPEPAIALDSLEGELGWERAGDGAVTVQLNKLGFANEDLAGTASGSYRYAGEGPGIIDLSARLTRADGRNTAKYLPLSSIMGENTRAWVASALLGGQASDAQLRLKGDLRDFPFADPAKGEFQMNAKVTGAILDYADGWPRIEGIEGDLGFDRDKIEVLGRAGTILGAKIANVRVTLPSLLANEKHVLVEGHAEGPTAEFFSFIQKSPVRRMVSGFTDGMSASGSGKLNLRLDLPLGALARSKVAGEYQFAGNNVTVDPRLPPVERAAGRVAFTESTLQVHDVRGQLFGGETRISGGTRADAGVVINAEGRMTVEGIRPVFDHPWRRRLTGSSRYSATVAVKEGRAQVSFDSTLEGVGSQLPVPLSKNPAEALPLHVDVFPGDGRDRISLHLGRVAAVELLRGPPAPPGPAAAGALPSAPSPQPAGPLQVQRAVITLNPAPGEAQKIPERRGVTVRGSLPALDLDRWLPLLGEGPGGGGATGAGGGEGASFDLKVGVLDALGKRMRAVIMLGVAEAGGWSATMSTQEFAGELSYRSEGSGKLLARFARFSIPEDSPGTKSGESAKDLPSVDIVAESFTHRNRKLGRIEILARHEGSDWRIDKLSMLNPESSLQGTGVWKTGEASRTSIKFKLAVSNVGQFLTRFGYAEHVNGGRGGLEGTLSWNGDPVTMDYATLGGELKMTAEDGQFLEIEPGIGKLVSLMSLQMLPRRIALDFRDVFSKGFQFDRISSGLDIERGVMAVKDFRMRGPAAEVSMSGQVDLSLETQALSVRVIPQLGDTASTVVGLVNPVAGVATLIAGRMLKNPVGKLFAFDYSIQGTWTDPKVEKVQTAVVTVPQEIPGLR